MVFSASMQNIAYVVKCDLESVFLRGFDGEKYKREEGRRLTRLKRYEVPGST
jgi:hypothetical protein